MSSKLFSRKVAASQHKKQPRVRWSKARHFFIESSEVIEVFLSTRGGYKDRLITTHIRTLKPSQIAKCARELDERFSVARRKIERHAIRGHSGNCKKTFIRFKGICAVAKRCDVTREHLYRVLTGERKSPLMNRKDVQALKEAGQ